MTGYVVGTENRLGGTINFDYTHFLCESSRESWTFSQALMVQVSRWRRRGITEAVSNETAFPSEAFASAVSHSLSSLYSDVSNLITLIEEAKKQNIEALNIMLPYALDESELDKIRRKTHVQLTQVEEERDMLHVQL